MKKRATFRFLAGAFAIGWLFQCLAVKFDVHGAGRGWLVAAMCSPLLAALLVPEARPAVWLAIKRARFGFWANALAAGWSFAVVQQLLLWMTNGGAWNARNFPLNADHSRIQGIEHIGVVLGFGPQGFVRFAANLLVSISLGSLITMVAAVGEEAGWRGFLQVALVERFGWMRSTLLIGVIWGLWHLPVNLAGYNDAQHPVLQTLLIFPIHTIAMSFVLALLMRRTASIWVVALAHGANNTIQSGPLLVPSNWFADQLTAVLASVLVGGLACLALYWETVGPERERMGVGGEVALQVAR